MENVLLRIKAEYKSFSKADRKIADFILKNPEKMLKLTSRQAAKEAQCSAASVIRFSKKYGCESFSDLKMNIAVALNEGTETAGIGQNDGFSQIYSKLLGILGKEAVEMKKIISDNVFEAFVRKLSSEKYMKFSGIEEIDVFEKGGTAVLAYETAENTPLLSQKDRLYLITERTDSEIARNAFAVLRLPQGISNLTKSIVMEILKTRIEYKRSVASMIK